MRATRALCDAFPKSMKSFGIATLVVLSLAALPTAARAASKRPLCAERGAVLRDANAHLRVYERRDQAIYACHVRTRRRALLTEAPTGCLGGSCRAAERWVLRGDRIAWASNVGDEMSDASEIRLANLATGSRRTSPAIPVRTSHAYERVTDLTISRNATVAWIAHAGTRMPDEGEERFVVRRRLSGSAEVLDSGLAIEAGSLASADQRIYWSRSGEPRQASA